MLLRAIAILLACLAATPAVAEQKIRRIDTQFIAALGDPDATAGTFPSTGAQSWGLWPVDPGPRGVHLTKSEAFLKSGTAPAGWTLDRKDWWVEEYGRIMESPQFPLPAGKYVVTGTQWTYAILTVGEKDAEGKQPWSLSDNMRLSTVTHQGCRAGRYQPETASANCTPASADASQFPVAPGGAMPAIPNCSKQDYQVLIVVGLVDEGA